MRDSGFKLEAVNSQSLSKGCPRLRDDFNGNSSSCMVFFGYFLKLIPNYF